MIRAAAAVLTLVAGVAVALTTPPLSGGTLLGLVLIAVGGLPIIDTVQAACVDDTYQEEEL